MEEKLNLIQKLAKIRGIADVETKSKRGYNYTYADITSILAKVTAGMKKYGVSLIPNVLHDTASVEQVVTKNTKVDKTGKAYENVVSEMLVKADMKFIWVNDEDPNETIEVQWFVVGMQADPSQAFGGGLTYCTRYFLTNYFQIAQTDMDVDSYRSKQKEAEASEARAVVSEIIAKLDTMVRTYLADNPDKNEDVKGFISRYVKNGNYNAIKEPAIAAKLLADFSNKYEIAQ